MNKSEFVDNLLKGPLLNYEQRWDKERTRFEIMPWEFLSYAEENLSSNDKGRLVDALSNVKRALDGQIELIIIEHGYGQKLKKNRWNFPRKIKFLKEHRIIAPRVLEKINKTRNVLEHEFAKPHEEAVEDAFDIVTLFIGYVSNLRRVPDRISVGFDTANTKSYSVEFDKTNIAFIVSDKRNPIFVIEENDKGYDRLLSLFHGTHPADYTLVTRNEIEGGGY